MSTCTFSMGYMEMKRINQELTSQVEALRGQSEQRESQHLRAVQQLVEEITEHKVLVTHHGIFDKGLVKNTLSIIIGYFPRSQILELM